MFPAGCKRAGSRGRGRAHRQGRAPGASSAKVRPTSSSPSGPSTSCQLGLDQLSDSWDKSEPVRSMFRCSPSSGPTSSEISSGADLKAVDMSKLALLISEDVGP